MRVEVAGRLVGEEHRRPGDERAADRHALLLPARELGRAVVSPVAQPDLVEQCVDPLALGLLPGDRERQHDVLLRREDRQQVEELEHEADVAPAQERQLAVAHRRDLAVLDDDVPGGRTVKPGQDVHKRRLAGAGRPHDSRELALRNLQRHVVERVDCGVALAVLPGDSCRADSGGRLLAQLVVIPS